MKEGIVSGLQCALGITAAILTHVVLSVSIVNKLIQIEQSYLFTKTIQFVGAGVIILIAALMMISVFTSTDQYRSSRKVSLSKKYFYQGLIVDLLNPIVSIFYIGMFSQYLTPETTNIKIYLTILAILFITIAWFGFVAIIFSRERLQRFYMKHKKYFEFISAVLLLMFGIKTMFS